MSSSKIDVFVSHHTKSSLHIVEAIVNQLEARGIRCWYAPRDTQGEYASSIYKIINECSLFLLILNGAASHSFDVMNEVNIACERVRKGETISIIPFHVDNDEVSDDAKYYLSRFHWIDAVQPPMYKRIEELAHHISALMGRNNTVELSGIHNEYRLISSLPPSREVFVGREALLNAMEKMLDEKGILFLEGIGGIGKTELVKQYAQRNKKKYDVIVFASYSSSIQNLICDDNTFLIEGLEQRRKEESEESYYLRKMQVLKMICNDRTLLIVDNYDVDSDSNFDDISELQGDIIFTSRNTHPLYPTLKVDAVQNEEELYEAFIRYYGSDLSDEKETVIQIIRLVNYHTYMVELTARQMEASFLSAKEMYTMLKNDLLLLLKDMDCFYARGEQGTAFQHMCALYNTAHLTDEEKYIMRCLSLIGINGIEANLFKLWAGLKSFGEISSLVRRSWIQRTDRKISLHPMVIQITRGELKPDEYNCETFLENIARYLFKTWNRPFKENLKIWDNIRSIADYFEKPDMKQFRLFSYYGSYMWQIGEFEESVRFSTKLYNLCKEQIGEDSIETAIMARNIGTSYFNGGRQKDAVPWFQLELKHLLVCNNPSGEELGLAYEKAARCYTWNGFQDFDKAKNLFDKALTIRKENLEILEAGGTVLWEHSMEEFTISQAKLRLGNCYLEIGRMYQLMKDYQKALFYTDQFQKIFEEVCPDNYGSLFYAYFDKSVSYLHIGNDLQKQDRFAEATENWKTALEYSKTALDYILRQRGNLAIDTVTMYEHLGDVYVKLSRFADASNAYMASLNISEALLGKDSARSDSIMKKMEFSKTVDGK